MLESLFSLQQKRNRKKGVPADRTCDMLSKNPAHVSVLKEVGQPLFRVFKPERKYLVASLCKYSPFNVTEELRACMKVYYLE